MSADALKKYWRTAVDMIHDGVMLIDTDGKIASANPALAALSGYSHDELIGQPCSILKCSSCEKIFDPTGKHWCKLFNTGEVAMQKCAMVRKDGTTVHVMKNASVLNEAGLIVGAVETLADVTELIEKDSQIEAYQRELQKEDIFEGMLGSSLLMSRTFNLIENIATSDAPALILGESGTGKELVALAIHKRSARKHRPFIKVNCSTLNESLLESELFGHVKGAFTGAYQSREGRFEAANGGDIFLDEIGDLSQYIQVKLLRVLEEKVIERVGDNKTIPVDVRIITATNRDLKALVENGSVRNDFYYRINVLPVELPSLRQRPEDIPLLAEMFFRHLQLKNRKAIKGICPEAMRILVEYHWPGNIRQLKSAFEYSFVTCMEDQIKPSHLPPDITKEKQFKSSLSRQMKVSNDDLKKVALKNALKEAGGNKSEAARILGISRVTVWNQMHRYNIY